MSSYAFDPDRQALTVSWSTGRGGRTATDVVAGLDGVEADRADDLCAELNGLTEAMWDTYDRPVSDVVGDEREELARGSETDALAGIRAAVTDPRRAHPGGLEVSYVTVDERANRVGRALDHLPDAWRKAVAADLDSEADAVVRAGLGDYRGRGQQAVWRDRLEVGPAQLTAALDALTAAPDPTERAYSLPGEVGVMAAAAATALLLSAAAETAVEAGARGEAPQVFQEADDVEACSVFVPATVVAAIVAGDGPDTVVRRLVADAVTVRSGYVPDLARLHAQLQDAAELAERVGDNGGQVLREASRLTELDTARPAADLFEHLLDGLRSSWVLYDELRDIDEDEDLPDPELEPEAYAAEQYATSRAEWLLNLTAAFSEVRAEVGL